MKNPECVKCGQLMVLRDSDGWVVKDGVKYSLDTYVCGSCGNVKSLCPKLGVISGIIA